MTDDLYGGLMDDDLPLLGAAALALGALGVTLGILTVAGGLAAAGWLRGRLHR